MYTDLILKRNCQKKGTALKTPLIASFCKRTHMVSCISSVLTDSWLFYEMKNYFQEPLPYKAMLAFLSKECGSHSSVTVFF